MPKEAQWPPRIHHHKSGQARVRVNGNDIYLGIYGSQEAAENYARLVKEGKPVANSKPAKAGRLTVAEVVLAYDAHARQHYRKPDGTPTSEIKYVEAAAAALLAVCPGTFADDFRGKLLKDVRAWMVARGWCRSNINHHVNVIKRMWRWLCGEEMVSAECVGSLKSVEALKAGRTTAPERPKVRPAQIEHVEKAIPYLTPHLAVAVRVQLYTACRPGEALSLNPAEIDRTGDVWHWRPESHKTAHAGKDKLILIGPKAQAVLLPLLENHAGGVLLSPRRSEMLRRAAVRAGAATPRKSPLVGRYPVGDTYNVEAYAKAVGRACCAAGVPHFSPGQLRHTAATLLAAEFGPVVAQTLLGHAHLRTTEIYAERDLASAIEAARKAG